MIVVSDAGPLIYLGGAGQLGLLPLLYERVVVPRHVYEEVVVAGAGMPGSTDVAEAAWLDLVSVDAADVRFVELSADMDPGEAAAICVAEDLGALLLCDDGLARAIAKDRGLPVIGTLGVLLRAKRLGKLSLIQPVIARMIKAGMRVSPTLLDVVLRQAEESPT